MTQKTASKKSKAASRGKSRTAKRLTVIRKVKDMQQYVKDARSKRRRIALVPTMGYLHEGHLSLVREARKVATVVVVSVFVNPTQFGPNEDLDRYPRDPSGDRRKLQQEGADVMFAPDLLELYPEGFQTFVDVAEITKDFCGASRPGHFDGVTTVVAKLFNSTKPHLAVFGQKDYQQLAVISRMVTDLDMDIRIIGVPIVREADGLAMSSRNSYLSSDERKSALCLKKSLELAKEMYHEGTTDAGQIKGAVESLIQKHPFTEIDYVTLCDPLTLEDIETLGDESLLALAVRVGRTRLIDNCLIRKKSS